MASQVLSGFGAVSYTNNTGQNVRVVINYLAAFNRDSPSSPSISISWGSQPFTADASRNTTSDASLVAIGRNLAYYNPDTSSSNSSSSTANNALGGPSSSPGALPTEIMLAPGQVFFAAGGAYNIVIIPENG
jgi:hypothetical protein